MREVSEQDQTRHGIPALLSLLFPGLGQLVKKQTWRAVMIWVLIAVPVFVATFALYARSRPPAFVFIGAGTLYLFALSVWLWGVVDAYNHPEG